MLSIVGENTVILCLLRVDIRDQPIKTALILEMAAVPFWSRCNALEGVEIRIPTVASLWPEATDSSGKQGCLRAWPAHHQY